MPFFHLNQSTSLAMHYLSRDAKGSWTLFCLPPRALAIIIRLSDQWTINNLASTAKHFFSAVHAEKEKNAEKQRRLQLVVPMPRGRLRSKSFVPLTLVYLLIFGY